MNHRKLLSRIVVVAVFGIAAYAGCQTGAPSVLQPDAAAPASISAGFAEIPLVFTAGVPAEQTQYIDVSKSLDSREPTDVAFGFSGDDLGVTVIPDGKSIAAKAVTRSLTLSLAVAEGSAATPCTSGIGAGRFQVSIADDGRVLSITSERPRLGEIVAAALRSGEIAVCTKVDANFSGQIMIRRTKIDVAFDGRDPRGTNANSNDNVGGKGDNTNGNTMDDNANDNTTDDNANDNSADDNSNGNEEDDDNANGNSADDNSNDNEDDDDDNSNDNEDDDNANDNSADDNSNGNEDDDNSNDNTADDNSNDNTADDNSNDNSSDDNTNGNANDNANDNTGGGLCPDGTTRLEGELDAAVELEVEYRSSAQGCTRFRVKVRSYATGSHSILVNGTSVGSIAVGGNGRGEIEFNTNDGSLPTDFPSLAVGDVVDVSGNRVTLSDDCSADDNDNDNANCS